MKKDVRVPLPTGALRYVGGGTYIPGVPARDLSPAEAQEFSEIIAVQEKASGTVLYEVVIESPAVAAEE